MARMAAKELREIAIKAPNFLVLEVPIRGTAPLVSNRWGNKAEELMESQKLGKAGKKKPSGGKDFNACFENARYKLPGGGDGIPCSAIRAACVRAGQLVGIPMTTGKMCFFVQSDDVCDDGTPCVRIVTNNGYPVMHVGPVRNATGVVDIRARPMWKEWSAVVRIRFDRDMLTEESILNLMERAGQQVGLLEGRPFSKDGCGCGWGTFTTTTQGENNGNQG